MQIYFAKILNKETYIAVIFGNNLKAMMTNFDGKTS
jgi:hypothetical protein